MDWIITTLNWYVVLFALGIIVFPLTRIFFHQFFDRGYPFAKTIAILALSYIAFILGIYKLLPFTQTSLILIIAVFVIGYVYFKRARLPRLTFNKDFFIFLFEEMLFIASLFFLAYIRGQEPSIRGLEKFMDYGFMKSILRSRFFPPLDMWFSGNNPINYYYFGHLTGAVLIKLTDIPSAMGYNLILATIFAQSITIVFSLVGNIIYLFYKSLRHAIFGGLLGTLIVNLAGNLHTIYLFTSGYTPDKPIPFWQILSKYNPTKYWYPNATRFIPFTIHEFPSYSYVVADLHGHVFDIPFVLLIIAILFLMFVNQSQANIQNNKSQITNHKSISNFKFLISNSILVGFLAAIHYMTNAFDGPIYILLAGLLFLAMFGISRRLFLSGGIMILSFLLFSFPFSSHFSPFVSGIGVNCSPDFLVKIAKLGPFLFEKGNCQPDPLWMLFVLWGFFWVSFLLFFIVKYIQQKRKEHSSPLHVAIDDFIFICFVFGTILIFIPEFFYIKDIYPAHFRANTMFKLGYQAFMIMGIASAYTFFRIALLTRLPRFVLSCIFVFFFSFIFIYPFYSFPSYYGTLKKTPELNGIKWLETTFAEDKEIIDFLNDKVTGQPIILEAQGDSYTDFARISANTGLPTVAGWWVHEWLWRGSANVVGSRIPDIVALYESKDVDKTAGLIGKYNIKYIVVSRMERDKYKNLFEEKFAKLADKIFTSSSGFGALYQVKTTRP
ncbi:MAG: DUF2298 domain-containing protein [Patescibacteria group bacterium]